MDSYYDTALRMHKSSETLLANNEYHNSCYLAGYVIECYAKIIIGLSYGISSNDLKFFGHDINEMNKEFQYIFNHSSYSNYMKDLKVDFGKITSGMTKWHPNKRYSDNSNLWSSQKAIDYQIEVSNAVQVLSQMKIDGHILI